MDENREYHIGIAPGEIPPLVLLPGDPDRAKILAEQFFTNPEEISKKREYWSFKGTYRGVPVAVCSTGIGCPSAAIAIEELIKVGCTTFVRVGTAGAISPSLDSGDIVILKRGMIDEEDMSLYTITDSQDDVISLIKSTPVQSGVPYNTNRKNSL